MKKWTVCLLLLVLLLAACAALADTAIDEANFPDPAFREFVRGYDRNLDGTLSTKEAAAVKDMDCSGRSIEDLTGIQAFTKLKTLNAGGNLLTALDVSGCTELQELICKNNPLTELNVTGNKKLQHLDSEGTFMRKLDLSGNPALNDLCVTDMASLRELNLTNNPKLRKLWTLGSGLTDVKIGPCAQLVKIYKTARQEFGNGYMYADKGWKTVLVVNGDARVFTTTVKGVRAKGASDFIGDWEIHSLNVQGTTLKKSQLLDNNGNPLITCVITEEQMTMSGGGLNAVASTEFNEADGSLRAVSYDDTVNDFYLFKDGTIGTLIWNDAGNYDYLIILSKVK